MVRKNIGERLKAKGENRFAFPLALRL